MLARGCGSELRDPLSARDAIERANADFANALPQVPLERMSVEAEDAGSRWRVIYRPPEGSTGPEFIDVVIDKRTGVVVQGVKGRLTSRLSDQANVRDGSKADIRAARVFCRIGGARTTPATCALATTSDLRDPAETGSSALSLASPNAPLRGSHAQNHCPIVYLACTAEQAGRGGKSRKTAGSGGRARETIPPALRG